MMRDNPYLPAAYREALDADKGCQPANIDMTPKEKQLVEWCVRLAVSNGFHLSIPPDFYARWVPMLRAAGLSEPELARINRLETKRPP